MNHKKNPRIVWIHTAALVLFLTIQVEDMIKALNFFENKVCILPCIPLSSAIYCSHAASCYSVIQKHFHARQLCPLQYKVLKRLWADVLCLFTLMSLI